MNWCQGMKKAAIVPVFIRTYRLKEEKTIDGKLQCGVVRAETEIQGA